MSSSAKKGLDDAAFPATDEKAMYTAFMLDFLPRRSPCIRRSGYAMSEPLRKNETAEPITPITTLAQKPQCQKEHVMADHSGGKVHAWTTLRAIRSSIVISLQG
jgi:hypothetical protein